MFERWEAGEQLEHGLERLSYSTLFAIPLRSFAILPFAIPSEVHAAAVSSDAYTPKSEVDVQQLKWLDAWHLERLGFDQVEVSIA